MNYREIDMKNDVRAAHYGYFCSLANPAAALTAAVDVTELLARLGRRSFFLSFLWCVERAANAVPELRRRIRAGKVIEFEACPTSSTVMKSDFSYAYCHLEPGMDYETFLERGNAGLDEAREGGTIGEEAGDALPCYFISCVPWLHYSHVVNPWGGGEDSNPRFTWGRYERREGRQLIPVTVMVHHGLVDGIHIARFYRNLESELANLCSILAKE